MRGRTVLLGLILLVGVILIAVAWRSAVDRSFEAELSVARKELVEGRHFLALEHLQQLAKKRPEAGEVQYLLGINALARGRDDQAEAAWAKVRPGDSPHFGYAALHQAELDQNRGQLSFAEERLRAGLADPGSHRPRVRWALAQLLILEGRRTEATQLLADGIAEHPEPIQGLRDLSLVEIEAFPIEAARKLLEASARQAPNDHRVRLGLAHLALRSGQFDQAKALLDSCLSNHPEDVPNWELALEWGLETGRADVIGEALDHLPASPERLRRGQEILAWAARQRGDLAQEHEALQSWNTLDPSNPTPLERLATLAIQKGNSTAAAELRAKRADREAALKGYFQRLGVADKSTDPVPMGRVASELGRETDAAYWLKTRISPTPSNGPSLAEALPELVSALEKVPHRDRPITTSSPRFRDSAEAIGLNFVHRSGAGGSRPIPPVTMPGGVATLDYDGDGWLDVYLVQSGSFPPESGTVPQGDRLFRNRRDGTFEDVSKASGIADFPGGYGHGVTVGDIDNDGFPDLFITRWRAYALYRNQGNGTFEDVTERCGLTGDRDWPTSAAFADLDNDGDLDLYVCHYLKWDENDPRSCLDPNDPSKYACGPRSFPALPDHLFRNDGGRFVDVSESAGIVDKDGRGLGVVAADLNGDGLMDLFVANDLSADYLWINRGGFQFEDQGLIAGVGGNESGGHQAGMGVDCGDFDGDGLPDLVVTNFFGESTSLFRNLGGGLFTDQSGPSGVRSASRYLLGFGVAFLDADNDGLLDLITANGHVHDGRPQIPWKMRAQYLAGRPGGRFEDNSGEVGEPFRVPRLGRGLATGDLDNDGGVDALLVALDESLVVFQNATESRGHFVTLGLEGTASNRDAIGAVVVATLGDGRRVSAFRRGGGSYQSSGEPRVQLGLGEVSKVDALEVRWPSGKVQRFGPLESGRGYRIREGDAAPSPLPGWETR